MMEEHNKKKEQEKIQKQKEANEKKEQELLEKKKKKEEELKNLDPKDIHIVDKMIQENMEKEDLDLKALSSIAGKPKKQEKFPAFKSPLIEKMAENHAV